MAIFARQSALRRCANLNIVTASFVAFLLAQMWFLTRFPSHATNTATTTGHELTAPFSTVIKSSSVTKTGSPKTILPAKQRKGHQCAPELTLEVVQSVSRNNTVMLAMVTENSLELFYNWVTSVSYIGIDYILVGAMLDQDGLAGESSMLSSFEQNRIPCFIHHLPSTAKQHGFEWGQDGWRQLTWQKNFVVRRLLQLGVSVVVSDIDVGWMRDPMVVFNDHPNADLIFSHDGFWSRNKIPSNGLEFEEAADVHYSLNAGVYMVRSTPSSLGFFNAWVDLFNTSILDDQHAMFPLLRDECNGKISKEDPGLKSAFKNSLMVGVMPVYSFANSHSYTITELHKLWKSKELPFFMHATWTYGGTAGKKSRLREAMLWYDSQDYYNQGFYLTVDLQVPEMPLGFNEIGENEPMIEFHLASLQFQLEQIALGMAIAKATNRVFIMPRIKCFCDTAWYPPTRCRLADCAEMQFPIICPSDYVFDMHELGGDESLREYSFLDNPRTNQAIKSSQTIVRFLSQQGYSASVNTNDAVSTSVTNSATSPSPVFTTQTKQTESELRQSTRSIETVRVWRLDFSEIPPHELWDVFAGMTCESSAQQFNARMKKALREWCCRFEDEAKALRKPVKEKLYMVPQGRDVVGMRSSC